MKVNRSLSRHLFYQQTAPISFNFSHLVWNLECWLKATAEKLDKDKLWVHWALLKIRVVINWNWLRLSNLNPFGSWTSPTWTCSVLQILCNLLYFLRLPLSSLPYITKEQLNWRTASEYLDRLEFFKGYMMKVLWNYTFLISNRILELRLKLLSGLPTRFKFSLKLLSIFGIEALFGNLKKSMEVARNFQF